MVYEITTLLLQHVKKNRDPRWEEEFHFTVDEPPKNEKLHVEVVSTSSRIGLLHPKVHSTWHSPFIYHSIIEQSIRMDCISLVLIMDLMVYFTKIITALLCCLKNSIGCRHVSNSIGAFSKATRLWGSVWCANPILGYHNAQDSTYCPNLFYFQ